MVRVIIMKHQFFCSDISDRFGIGEITKIELVYIHDRPIVRVETNESGTAAIRIM